MENGVAALEVVDLVKHFRVGGRVADGRSVVHAVNGVSFELRAGEMLGLVGESGSGKSTIARCLLRLLEPTAGKIRLRGTDITRLSRREMRPMRRQLHIVFQNPFSSLNPRMPCGAIVGEPLRLHRLGGRRTREERVAVMFDAVGLQRELCYRYPHELSGGQRQRVALARALIVEPNVLVADEPVSALDTSFQAGILNLLQDLRTGMGFSCLFITHDLAAVKHFCDRIAVLHAGKIIEVAPRAELFKSPQHPFTQALLSATPVADPRNRGRRPVVLAGEHLSPLDAPSGCCFRTRCPLERQSAPQSSEQEPTLREFAPGHFVACHLVGPGRPIPRLDAGQDLRIG
jgi:oligopeptide transport system ATP-binding protein